jgi:SH2 domain
MYPVALTLARERINKLWECLIPKWIEGFITKEEAENVLRGPKGPQKLGTFLLRFPTTRSWPHPDAGNLVISYVGSDSMIHHKLLALNYRQVIVDLSTSSKFF